MTAEVIQVARSDKYPKKFFDGMFVIFKMGGLYHPEKTDRWYAKIFWWLFNISMIVLLHCLYQPAEFAMIPYTMRDLNLLVEHVGMIATHMMGVIKYYIIFYNYKKLRGVIDILDREEFKYEDSGDYKPGETMAQCRKYSNYICIMFFWIGTLVPVSKQFDSLLKFIHEGDMVDAGNYTCQDMLPYFSYFPFYIETTRRCQLAFLLQTIPMIWYVYSVISGDCAFGCYCIAFRGHFVNLRGAFLTVTERCTARLGLPEDYDVLHVEENPALQREIKLEMRRMTIHLQTMIDVCNTFEDVVNVLTLCQTLTSMFLIVSCLYMISEEPFMSPVFIAEAEYVGAGMIQLFVYCVFGNEMTESSGAVAGGIYESKWYYFSQGEKRTMLINMLRLQVPIQFTTGKFAVLTLSTFVSIVKGSYSYFTFLKQSK